jgi:hypothetical protein
MQRRRAAVGSFNTGIGMSALYSYSTGANNTGAGAYALYSNSTGANNNASGYQALYSNTTANDNNAMGAEAMYSNTTGTFNNAMGGYAMYFNTTGSNNNAVGYGSMYHNTTGSNNTAQGRYSLSNNTTGYGNSAFGAGAAENITTGVNNTGLGIGSLNNNTTGSGNIAVGELAGTNLTTGSNNIDIGNAGVAAESGIIRIGTHGTQSAAYMAGITGNVLTGATVVVTASGELGVASSSRRYKEDVEPLGDVSERLARLRPVKFRYIKADEQGAKPLQFGLIAEEVAEVLPELVYRNAQGMVEGVRYEELAPMLLDEMQKQQRINSAQAAEIRELKGQVAELNELKREMRAALQKLQSKDALVALR